MSSEGTSSAAQAPADDFEAIEKAVMESRRGRWFLEEYGRRLRVGETQTLLTAIGRIENAVTANQDVIAERLGKALGLIAAVDSRLSSVPARTETPPIGLSAHHMKFFRQDEELFEAPSKPAVPIAVAVEPRPEAPMGARLVIRRQPEPVNESAGAAAEPAMEFSNLIQPDSMAESATAESAAELAPAEAPLKNRIVIIRHKAGEAINVPLHDEIRASA